MNKALTEYISFRAQTKGLPFPDKAEQILKEHKDYAKRVLHINLKFTRVGSEEDHAFDLFSTPTFSSHKVVLNAEWAVRLALYPEDQALINAFHYELAHEAALKKHNFRVNLGAILYAADVMQLTKERFTFLSWCEQICADFHSIEFLPDGRKTDLMRSTFYRMGATAVDRHTAGAPSWQLRGQFIMRGKFNESLIREMAEGLGYRKPATIRKIVHRFQKEFITLNH